MKLVLTGPQLRVIREAIVAAYEGAGANSLAELDQALADYLEGRKVFNLVTVLSPFPLQVGQLLVRANAEGWLPSLLGAVQQDKPDAEALQNVVRSFIHTASAQDVLHVAASTGAITAGLRAELQQMLPGGAINRLDTMQRRVRAVCRIDYADLSPPGIGTGFLVGPDLVLTNWHNLKRAIEAPAAARELRFRFDLLDSTVAVDNAGRVVRVKANSTSILRSSPTGGVELSGGNGEPNMQQLDYALVRLDERVADDPLPGGATRGFIGLKRAIPQAAAGSALMVLQHPLRSELQFAIGVALGPNETSSRLRHTVSTQRGSSGSPVLDAALAAIALHNGTRFGTQRSVQEFNTAVPLAYIVADLAGAGFTEMLQE